LQLDSPDGVVRHKCDNSGCVSPDHLEVGTQQDNMDDMWRRGRGRPRGKTTLTDQQVSEIVRDSRRQVDIAADYGIHQTMVSLIKRKHGVRSFRRKK
jgi:hypothetical protein